METISYPLRVPRQAMVLVKLRSEEEYVDKSTALRQLLYMGVEDYALKLCEEGRISISKVAEILNKSIYKVYELARKKGIKLGASKEQQKKSEKVAKKLFSS